MIQKIYLVGIHRYAFRAGSPALVIGIKSVKPKFHGWRLAYEIEFPDGVRDYTSLEDVNAGNHVFITENEFLQGKIPEITR